MDEQPGWQPQTTPRAARRHGRRRFVLIAACLLVVVAVGLWLRGRSAPQAGRGRYAQTAPQPVSVATIGTGQIRVVLNGLGAVTPIATVTVRTQINGRIVRIGFTEGQIVHKGDFLVQIDPRPYQVALEQAQGDMARDEALLEQAKIDAARYSGLARLQSIARQQAEDQQFLVKQYAGDIVIDQAAIDSAKLNLDYCHIVAPVDGRVGLRQVDLGNYVQTSDTNGLVVITQLQPMSVVFSLPEDDLPQIEGAMRSAKPVALAFDRSNTKQLASGVLDSLDTQVDNTTGTVKMRALFDNADGALFPQQFVNVELVVQVLDNVVTAPAAAVQHGAPGTFVYRLDAGGVVHVVTVTTGPSDGDNIAITAGLKPGDQVVTDGTDRLKDGAKVTVPGAGPKPAAAPSGTHRHGHWRGGAGE